MAPEIKVQKRKFPSRVACCDPLPVDTAGLAEVWLLQVPYLGLPLSFFFTFSFMIIFHL